MKNTFKEFTKEQIELLFNNLTIYGLELMGGTIEAWQYDHYEDATILKEAYENIYDCKINEQAGNKKSNEQNARLLTMSLKKLKDREIRYLNMLLELDPSSVFEDDSYLEHDKMCEYVKKETSRRIAAKKTSNESNTEMSNPSSDEAFSNRFKRSLSLKRTPDGFRPYSF